VGDEIRSTIPLNQTSLSSLPEPAPLCNRISIVLHFKGPRGILPPMQDEPSPQHGQALRIARLTGSLVLVSPHRELDEAAGSIIIPERYRSIVANDEESLVRTSDQWATATVLMIGPGKRVELLSGPALSKRRRVTRRLHVDLKVGSVVLYKRAEGSELCDGTGRVLVQEASILGTLALDTETKR